LLAVATVLSKPPAQTLDALALPELTPTAPDGREVSPFPCSEISVNTCLKARTYQDEMAVFLWDEFGALITAFSTGRALASVGWSEKAARRIAKERNAELRDFYLCNLSSFRSYHLIYVDESGCNKRIWFRRTGWSPLGVMPVQIAQFQREQRYQILTGICPGWHCP
jgi:hypothetical protein